MGRPVIDIVGKKFGKLTVIKRNFDIKDKTAWWCMCDCGNTELISVIGNNLKRNTTKSCGCILKKMMTKHSLKEHPLYDVWSSMKQRCSNKNNKSYINYGARGISVCEEWENDVVCFIEWCELNGYKKGLEIDRINTNGNYEPSNCQFITKAKNLEVGKTTKQNNNTSGYTGVIWHKRNKKWMAQIKIDRNNIGLGYYDNIEDALQARISKEIELFGKQKTNLVK